MSTFEHAFLTFGTGLMALLNPRRGDMVAAFGELTAGPVLPGLRDKMLASEEGRAILKERPRINTKSVDIMALSNLPEGTLGRAYVTWLERCGVTPDTRAPVHYVDDPELAYVMQRYRECHDLYHCITSMPVRVEYEIVVKAFEFANLGLPMTGLAAVGAPFMLPAARREKLKQYIPWALKCGGSARSLITVYWERRWDQDIGELRKELGIWDPPPAVWGKPLKETTTATKIEAS